MSDFVVREWKLDPYPGDQAPPHVHWSSDEALSEMIGGPTARAPWYSFPQESLTLLLLEIHALYVFW